MIVGGAQLMGDEDQSAPRPASKPTPTETTTPAPAEVHKLPLPKRFGDSAILDKGRYTVRLRNLPRELDQGGLLLSFEMNVPEGWKVTKPLIRAPYPSVPSSPPPRLPAGSDGSLSSTSLVASWLRRTLVVTHLVARPGARSKGSLRRSPGCPGST